jgi:enoyl-CoA hydratase/carnithine racemase
MALIQREDRNSVASLVLSRPEKLNAVTRGMLVELREHMAHLAVDDAIDCVVLSGAGRCFGAGHDLSETGLADDGEWRDFDARTIDLLEQLPQPTIAKIHGYCFTGSLELALACDLLVAGESAQFADTHGERGLVPIWGMSVRLPERIGLARAKDLAFTARRVGGPEALDLGLVDRCVPDDDLDAAVGELAAQIVANSPGTNRMTKALYAVRPEMSRTGALAHERTRPFGFPADREQRR